MAGRGRRRRDRRRGRVLAALARTAALTGAAAQLLVGCTASLDAAPPALPDGLEVSLTQLRSDVADRQIQVRIDNGTDAGVTVGAVEVHDPRFVAPAGRVVDRVSTLAAGAAVNVRVQLAGPACAAPSDAEPAVTVTYVLDGVERTGSAAASEVFPFLAALHEGDCRAERLAESVTLSWGGFVAGVPGEPGMLKLTAAPVAGAADVRIVAVHETNLLTFAGVGGIHPLDDDGEVLALVPARCDPHAVQEDKRGTVFTIDVEVDGQPGSIELPAPSALRGELLTWVAQWCGYGAAQ